MTTVTFGLLGPVEARVDGRAVPLGYAKQRCVLALLMCEVGRVVPVDRVIDRVWGQETPDSARNLLYGYVARLRAALAAAGLPDRGALLRRHPGGYTLDVDPDAVDLFRFRRLVREARAAAAPMTAMALLDRALALWRGPALSCIDNPWAERMRVTLEGERVSAWLARCDAQLQLGMHDDLVSDSAEMLTEHPLHEGVATRLMLALYRSGRIAEALHCFTQVRQRLVRELGTEPGRELRNLHQLILRRDAALPMGSIITAAVSTPAA